MIFIFLWQEDCVWTSKLILGLQIKKNVIDSSDDYFHDSLILNFFDKMEKKKKLEMSNPISQRSK